MTTLSINNIDSRTLSELQKKAKLFNLDVNDLVKQLISYGLNNLSETNSTSIDSIFGLISSSTDGLEFQQTMREE